MKQVRRWQRILILSLLSITVFAPLVFVSTRIKSLNFIGLKEPMEDMSNIKYRTDGFKLNSIEQEDREGFLGPKLVVYKAKNFVNDNFESTLSRIDEDTDTFLVKTGSNHEMGVESEKQKTIPIPSNSHEKEHSNETRLQRDKSVPSQSLRAVDAKIKEIKDQLIRGKAYVILAPPGSNSHLVKELRTRMKELEQEAGMATEDTELSRSALRKMKTTEASLSKASHVFPDCAAMATKLRAMTYNAVEQVRAHKNEATYLAQLAGRTTPKGLHCLSMRLTAEFFELQPEERQLGNQQKLLDPSNYHYAVFSDNILACAVVVNSTVSFAKEPEKIVFHVVTDSLNLPAISMWFLLNPPGKATIHIQKIEDFDWLSSKYKTIFNKQDSLDERFTSALNHLRFYLPDIFPGLNKIVLFDHDVVVQKDLSELWTVDMNGKVNAAVETCQEGETSFRRMDMFINFSDTSVAENFDVNTCTWAFGMNLFDLQGWRRQKLTSTYGRYLQLGYNKQLWMGGSLPLGWVTFYKQTVGLDKKWNTLGLGYESGVTESEIDEARVIHYDGIMKPWLDIGIAKYRSYWNKHLDYDRPYFQQCNIHRD